MLNCEFTSDLTSRRCLFANSRSVFNFLFSNIYDGGNSYIQYGEKQRKNMKNNRNLSASRTDEGFPHGVGVSSRSVKRCILSHSNPFLSPAPPQGHAAPVLYAAWAETGYLKENELLNLRKVDSILEGHPVPVRQRRDLNVSVWRSFIPTNQHVCIHTTFLTWGQLSCLMVSSTRSKITPSPCMFQVKLDCSSSPVLHVAFCQTLSSHRLFWLWGNLLTASKNLEILIWRDQRNVCRWMQSHWSMQPFDMFLSAVPL